MDNAELLARARQKFFSRANASLADVLETLHREAMAAGPDVRPHMQTLYLTYASGRTVFASILPRQDGCIELGLTLPAGAAGPRLMAPTKTVWRKQTHSVHVRTGDDIDDQVIMLIGTAYASVEHE